MQLFKEEPARSTLSQMSLNFYNISESDKTSDFSLQEVPKLKKKKISPQNNFNVQKQKCPDSQVSWCSLFTFSHPKDLDSNKCYTK